MKAALGMALPTTGLIGNTTHMSIGVVTVAYGAKCRAFLPRWVEAINSLAVEPDEVTVVTDDLIDATMKTADVNSLVRVIKAEGTHTHHPQVYANQAVEVTSTEWICKMDVDDIIYPHAFDRLGDADCDVWMFGIRYCNQSLYAPAVTAEHIMTSPHNLVFSGSPYRRWLHDEATYRDMIYEDWMFWIDCAAQGARFCHSNTIDYEYVMHDDNISTRADDAYWQSEVRRLRDQHRHPNP